MILVMSAILIGGILGVIRRGEAQRTADMKSAVAAAVRHYYVEHGTCPENLQRLIDNRNISARLVEDYETELNAVITPLSGSACRSITAEDFED